MLFYHRHIFWLFFFIFFLCRKYYKWKLCHCILYQQCVEISDKELLKYSTHMYSQQNLNSLHFLIYFWYFIFFQSNVMQDDNADDYLTESDNSECMATNGTPKAGAEGQSHLEESLDLNDSFCQNVVSYCRVSHKKQLQKYARRYCYLIEGDSQSSYISFDFLKIVEIKKK